MKTQLKLIAAAAIACVVASSCATQTRTESEFGDSVRAVSTGQIYDMGAAQYPDKNAVTGGHGDRLENVVKSHASDTSQGVDVNAAL